MSEQPGVVKLLNDLVDKTQISCAQAYGKFGLPVPGYGASTPTPAAPSKKIF